MAAKAFPAIYPLAGRQPAPSQGTVFPAVAGRLQGVLSYFPAHVSVALSRLPVTVWDNAEEIRLRVHRPLTVTTGERDLWVTPAGTVTHDPAAALHPDPEDVETALQLMCQGSVYAREEELRAGFITLAGGYRVGIAGRTIIENGTIRGIRPVTSLAVRIPREIKDVASGVLPLLLAGEKVDSRRFMSTLVVSAPRGGKTTMLRDLVRLLSSGHSPSRWPGARVVLVDERAEVAASYLGVPQCDVGLRTDVLDGCPKAAGLMLAIRALAPQILATDEIGGPADVAALAEAAVAGVAVLATAHARDRADVLARPGLRDLVQTGVFQRLVVISRRQGPGTVEAVLDEDGAPVFSPGTAQGYEAGDSPAVPRQAWGARP